MTVLKRICALGERLLSALTDPVHRTQTAALLILGYVAVWTVYATVSNSLHDLHVDMTEEAALARDFAFGYFKHPPVSVWVPGAWFALFPHAEWAYYLLSMSVVGVGLFAAWSIATRLLDAEKAALALALLTFVPFFNFHAIRFNANSLQIAIWPLATLFFLRSLERQRAIDAVAAGALAALALLTKYWAIFLLAGFFAAACLHPERARYFRSAAPWISAATGVALITPHVGWLVQHDFLTLQYAAARSAAAAGRLSTAGGYLAATLAYIGATVAAALWALRADRDALIGMLAPSSPQRRSLTALFAVPILLPVVLTLATGANLNGLWSMPAFALLPIVLLGGPRPVSDRRRAAAAIGVAAVVPVAFAAVSPAVAVAQAWSKPNDVDLRALTKAVEAAWAPQRAPLRIVAGSDELAYGVAFYATDRPSPFPNLSFVWAPFLDEARLARDGMAIVCGSAHAHCLAEARKRAAGTSAARHVQTMVAGGSFIRPLPPAPYAITVIPPAGH